MTDRVAIERAVRSACEHLPRWPARLRFAGPLATPWLAKLFEGVCDPRVELLGWASMKHEVEHRPGQDPILGESRSTYFSKLIRPIVLVFARHMQPDFTPPDVLLARESEVYSASGCGGGFETETWGDAQRGIRWHATITEHAADDSSAGAWTAYGLNEGMMLEVGDRERGAGTYSFEVAGPTPAVLELALAWGALLRGGPGWTPDEALARLATSRVSF